MGASSINTLIIAFNGLTLTLALGFLLLVVWLNPRRQLNLYFSLFAIMVILWTVGTVLGHAAALLTGEAGSPFVELSVRLLDIGFAGACIGVYLFTTVLIRSPGRFFLAVSVAGFVVALGYQGILLASGKVGSYAIIDDHFMYDLGPLSTVLYVLFGGATLLSVWFQGRRIRERWIAGGVVLFVIAQALALLNPRLRSLALPALLGDVSVLLISLALVRQQVVGPLVGRASQLEAVRDVGLTITSRLRLSGALSSIAAQATALLEADGAAIYMLREDVVEVAAVHNMPEQFIGYQLALGEGIAGKVAVEGQTVRIEDYITDWRGALDLPLASSAFGSVVVAPLVFSETVQGVLLVVQGRQGKVFNREDVHLLELLGPQAAIAIANSRLFEQQSNLTDALVVAKNQLETVLTSTQNPVVAVDRSFRIIFVNPAAESLLTSIQEDGRALSSLEGRLLLELMPATEWPDVRAMLRSLRERRAYIYEVELAQHVYMCHVAQLGYPRPVGLVGVLHDISELKELDRLKSQMVRMTSHDLKNPLFAAMSYLELLEEDLLSRNIDDLNSYVETIMQQLDRMNRTISGILDLERFEAGGPLADELCQLPGLLEKVLAEMAPLARAHDLSLGVDIPNVLPVVLGDRQQLMQTFANVIDNAIKFTPQGGQVFIRGREHKGGVLISVQDTGVGIPRELHSQVFERFFRAQQEGTEHVGGSGLGLSLVHAVVTAHEGQVWLDSEPGQGTTVYVWLPCHESGGGQGHLVKRSTPV